MVVITLPDGSQRRFDAPPTVAEVAASIGAGLAKAAIAGKVDGRLVDTSHRIESDATLAIVTERDPEGLEIIRHSTAHLLAWAVKSLFPDAQVTIGPVIENGFYYDFSYKRPFTPEDLVAIEAKMAELAKANLPVVRELWDRAAVFVDPRNPDAIAKAIDFLANDADARERLARAAQQTALRYTIPRQATGLMNAYMSAVAAHSRAA